MRKLAVLAYPVKLNADENGTVVVTFPDVPEAVTFGETRNEALNRAVDALETALSMYVDDRRELPKPSPARGRAVVAPTLLGCMKLELYQAMREAGLHKADLARRMGVYRPQVDRLLDLSHASRLDQIEAALASLGKRLAIAVRDAA